MSDSTYVPRQRLFVPNDLHEGADITLDRDQSHYLVNVMRARPGAEIGLFNGRDGEWRARLDTADKRAAVLQLAELYRPQAPEPDLWLAFSPIKKVATDFLVTKATEVGVSRLVPVMTDRTQSERVNTRRLAANAVEAAEQCERLTVPSVDEPVSFETLLAGWDAGRRLLVGDETGNGQPVAEVAGAFEAAGIASCAVLVGPEGGFSARELDALRKLTFVTAIGLGPRILRADTAALAALVVLQAIAGDWRENRRRH